MRFTLSSDLAEEVEEALNEFSIHTFTLKEGDDKITLDVPDVDGDWALEMLGSCQFEYEVEEEEEEEKDTQCGHCLALYVGSPGPCPYC